ncbi:hypothetical protein LCGC14_0274160 [marine sediment metagenome]|uniref:Uncharacterized protein n=2 Tax=root TaxID=1 RepID=A0A9C9NED9_9HYPH|nr:hypothetical protein [Aurantimonas coralicida]
MPRFFVVHGYSSPDNYAKNGGPVLEITEAETPSMVANLRFEHEQCISHREANQGVFRVFERERFMVEKERVTEWELKA